MSSSPNSSSSSETVNLPLDVYGWVMDVPCPVDFVLGTTTVKVRDFAAFGPNAIIRLKQQAGSDLEVHVGGVPVAAGEVVIIEENVGLRLSRILPPAAREVA
jgi:flagellar motor switch protein FliN/FliY